jgi:hypothetical protein
MTPRQLLLVLLFVAAGCRQGTYVLLRIDQAIAAPTTTRLDLDIALDGQKAHTSLHEAKDGAIVFPTYATLDLGKNNSGRLTVIVTAVGSDGGDIDQATCLVDVTANRTSQLDCTLGAVRTRPDGASDGGSSDAGEPDGSRPDGNVPDGSIPDGSIPDSSMPDLAVVPGAPLDVTAQSGDAQVTVSWSAPADVGSSPISFYSVKSLPDDIVVNTSDGQTTTATINGLRNGTSYTFTVTATNSAGTGPAAKSNPVTPTATQQVPTAPTMVSAVADLDRGAHVSWVAVDNRGSPLKSYQVTSPALNGTIVPADPSVTSTKVYGLSPGTKYTFIVTATNGVGTSLPSPPSPQIIAATTPGAPSGVTAAANIDLGLTVGWSAPTSDGFSSITKYTVRFADGSVARTTDGTTTSAAVTGLKAGTSYGFTVTASNAIGDGPTSAQSTPIIVQKKLDTPANVSICRVPGEATVSFSPVAGATSYDVFYSTSSPATQGNRTSITTTSLTLTLSNGTYYVAVAAVSGVGDGNASAEQTLVMDDGVHDTLFAVAQGSAPALTNVLMWDCYSTRADQSAPTRTLSYNAVPVGMAVDGSNGVLWVSDGANVRGWIAAGSINGSVNPDYQLHATSDAYGIALDYVHKKLYVSSGNSNVSRYGYTQPSDLNGSPQLEVLFQPIFGLDMGQLANLYVDQASGNLWSTHYPNGSTNGAVALVAAAHLYTTNSFTDAGGLYRLSNGAPTDNYSAVAYSPAGGGTLFLGSASNLYWILNADSLQSATLTASGSIAVPQQLVSLATGDGFVIGGENSTTSQYPIAAWSDHVPGSVVKAMPDNVGRANSVVYIP